MDAADLMIGDLVLYVDKEGEIETPCKILSLNQNGEWSAQILNTKFLFQGNNEECSVKECLKPIPLIPETLEENGFYNSNLVDDYSIAKGIHYNVDSKQILFGFEYGTALEIKCEFVHELQHLLRLCGIEKEIIL